MEYLHICFLISFMFAANLAPVVSVCSLFFNGSEELRYKLADYFDKNSATKVLEYKLQVSGYPEDYLEPKIRSWYRAQEYGAYFLFLKIEEFTSFIPWFNMRDEKEKVILRDDPQYCLKENSTDEVEIIVRNLLMKDFGIDKTRKNMDIELSHDVKVCLSYKINQPTDFRCCFWDSTKEMKCHDLEQSKHLSSLYKYTPYGLAVALLVMLLLFTSKYLSITFVECSDLEKNALLNREIISVKDQNNREQQTIPVSRLMQKGKTKWPLFAYLPICVSRFFSWCKEQALSSDCCSSSSSEDSSCCSDCCLSCCRKVSSCCSRCYSKVSSYCSCCSSSCWREIVILLMKMTFQYGPIYCACCYFIIFYWTRDFTLSITALVLISPSVIMSLCQKCIIIRGSTRPTFQCDIVCTALNDFNQCNESYCGCCGCCGCCKCCGRKCCGKKCCENVCRYFGYLIVNLFSLIPMYFFIVVCLKIIFDVVTYLFLEFERLNIILVVVVVPCVYLYDCLSKMNAELKYCLEDFESQLDKLFEKSSSSGGNTRLPLECYGSAAEPLRMNASSTEPSAEPETSQKVLEQSVSQIQAACPLQENLTDTHSEGALPNDITTTFYIQVSYNKIPSVSCKKIFCGEQATETFKQLVYFFDTNGNIYFSKQLFHKCCSSYFKKASYHRSMCGQLCLDILKFAALGLYLTMIGSVIWYFDKLYDLSNLTTFAATFAGGLLPKLASPLFTLISSKSEVKLREENKRFIRVIHETIKTFEESFSTDSDMEDGRSTRVKNNASYRKLSRSAPADTIDDRKNVFLHGSHKQNTDIQLKDVKSTEVAHITSIPPNYGAAQTSSC